jgi:CheY-like chemotaxis protein
VLVVDDDPDVRRFVADALETLGHSVVQAAGGAEALAALGAARPDAVLLDYAMPGMTGVEAAEIIGREHPRLPILFMTGYADAEALEPLLGRSATVLRKPFHIDELDGALSAAMAP